MKDFEIINTLKEMQLYKAVQDATFCQALHSLNIIKEEEYTPQLTIQSIISKRREPAIAYRFDRVGITINETFFTSLELATIYKESCLMNGAVWIPIKNKTSRQRLYLCVKNNDKYIIAYEGTIIDCSEGPANPDSSLCINETVANQEEKYWIKVTDIKVSSLTTDDIISINSKKTLAYAFTGSQSVINCI